MATSEHTRLIERLSDRHEERVLNALNSLEERISDIVIGAPTDGEALSDPAWAIGARVEIESSFRDEFLSEADALVREYDDAVASLNAYYKQLGAEFVVSDAIVANLKRVSFQGFEDIASRFSNELANELYQNTLAGRPKSEAIRSIRQKINGVYMESDKAEINRLVEIAKGDGDEAARALELLHREYAADRTGNNMRRYASQMVNDSLTQFDSSVNLTAARELGITKFKYVGDTVSDTRDWCRRHLNKTYTEEEIREMWSSNSWQGKAPGDPFVVRGGYNCRHQWEAVIED
jgi:hypothetical protein